MSSITKKVAATISATAAFGLPMLALAQLVVNPGPIRGLTQQVLDVFNAVVVPILVAIAVVWIIIAAFQFALSGGDEEKRTAARNKMVWGLVGIVIIFAIYGIVRVLAVIFTPTIGALPSTPSILLGI